MPRASEPVIPASVGVDVGGTHTKVALVDARGSVRSMTSIPTRAREGVAGYFENLRMAIASVDPAGERRGIGVALPGFLNSDRDTIEFNPNTPFLEGVDFRKALGDLSSVLAFEQDLNASALAAHLFTDLATSRRLVGVAVGTGLGAAVIVDGHVLRFAGQTAGDNGHIILDPAGPRCSAGCGGCGEAFVSTAAIERLAAPGLGDADADDVRRRVDETGSLARAVISSAVAGTAFARSIVGTVGTWLGQWLASIAPLFLPDAIVVSGGVSEAGSALLDPCIDRFRSIVSERYRDCPITRNAYGVTAGVVGAAGGALMAA